MIQRIPLKDLCSIDITDGTHKTPTYADSGYIFLSSKNVTSGEIDWDNVMYIPEELHKELYQRLAPQKDDILLAKNGTTGVAALVDREEIFDIYVSLALIRPDKNKIIPKYLLYAINSESSKRYFDSHLKGVGVPNLHLTHIRETPISVPDFHTQEEIIKRLDKVSDLIAKRRQQLDKLDLLVKARFVEMFGDSYSNIHNLPKLKWADVFYTTTGKLDSNASVENGEYPFFTCSKEVLRIDKYAFDQEALLLAGNNAAGKYDVKHYKGKFNAYQRTYVLSLKEDWSYPLFRFQLENKLKYLEHQSLGGLTKYLTLKILGELEFLIPEREEQNRFTDYVECIEVIKVNINQSLEKLEMLKKALMQEYFG